MHVPIELVTILEELTSLLTVAAELSRRACDRAVVIESKQTGRLPKEGDGASRRGVLFVSSATCSVEWRGHRCVLGPSLPFRLLYCLSGHPGRFFPYGLLMEQVWRGHVSDEAVRAIVKRLRRSLKDAGMADLAAAICGQDRSYALFLPSRTF
ncbi:MAG: winged helix-turn-helix domain-containing protein [Planctomycetes bacterium]|nr:winged helix-turn-helix domain-containing protein [Planctomycetota bacterium]